MMHQPSEIFSLLREQGICFFTGVPDSLLKNFCVYVSEHTNVDEHVITANEGNAIALAAGHFFATGAAACVYMQNSGFGNAVNPLLSLASPEVYSVPMLLMVGWRGETGVRDEPQHEKQGRVMTGLMDAMETPWFEFSANTADALGLIQRACSLMRERSVPVVLLVRKGTFATYTLKSDPQPQFPMTRESAIRCVIDALDIQDVVVSTTGMASRELYEYRMERGDGHGNDFLTVGSMGHTASIAMGVARGQVGRKVVCLDGDGSLLMHMGTLAVIGQSRLANFLHVVINNGAHDSVGGQPTVGLDINFPKIALACGYAAVGSVSSEDQIPIELTRLREIRGPVFLEIKVRKGSRVDLGRPKTTPLQNRDTFMTRLGVGIRE